MSYPIVLDLETQFSLQQIGYDAKKLKVSLVAIYDYGQDEYFVYKEKDLAKLFTRLEHASFLIGFNIRKFDLAVLAPYYIGNIAQFNTLDILEEVEKELGFRVALNELVKTTLGVKKSGHGFLAINYFNKGEWDKLERYCLDDVKITKQLYEYGKKYGKLYYDTAAGKREIPVNLKKEEKKNTVSLSLPF